MNTLNIPLLVGADDQDELFEVDKVREFYDAVPGNKKEFFNYEQYDTCQIPLESWQQVVVWLDKSFI